MDLHYSQTLYVTVVTVLGFTTLWIYTILKLYCNDELFSTVSLPYGFTLFSNISLQSVQSKTVSLPYGFTLFSNWICERIQRTKVSLPYGFTLFSNTQRTLVLTDAVSLPYGFTLFSNTLTPTQI